ncbi:hypothetical protein B484DRAFT_459907 [Ochromonadaceae sp. CCMP2298]|nr:hypothetical protein B484DRAFT_459907 [Ochromonadaceae sp. CCMP2298]|eukprot:CAMPEP_0173178736 /NCGR_PEP_ID=MMETSP1141-20130122/5705_1 /TAXON_ID=483371 /ORGANISM="non described non described, Strain CCMP2298" /LENGTH=176 /DNA_ID=CAMNT_0014101267 /DNA_START=350 /DNA_END=880 /DNA_ORIENTATION=+
MATQVGLGGKLPKELCSRLKNAPGCLTVKDQAGVTTYDLRNCPEGVDIYHDHLRNGKEVDPFFMPMFGNPLSPFSSPQVQGEVFDLLSTMAQWRAPDFNGGAPLPPFVPQVFPLPALGICYQHAQIAMLGVMSEIQEPTRYLANAPFINSLPGGQFICDMNITYAASGLVLRLQRR